MNAAGAVSVCVWRGYHVANGSGYGTNADAIVWSGVCMDCGERIAPPDGR